MARNILKKHDDSSLEKLSLLITIVQKGKGDFYIDCLEGMGINAHFKTKGKGTAPTKMMDLLGLTQTSKDVVFSILPESKTKSVVDKLNAKFATVKNGNGICMVVPVSALIGVYAYRFLADIRIKEK